MSILTDFTINHIVNDSGNKYGNRRSANIRSVGYSDLFVLSKEALWNALDEYPEAKKMLMAKCRQMLSKDNMLDDWALRDDRMLKFTREQRVEQLEEKLSQCQTRLARLIASYTAVSRQLNLRVDKLHQRLAKLHHSIE